MMSATDRLSKLLGMTGSAHDGEALAAARKANEFVRRLGLTWNDVISVRNVSDARHPPASWQRMAFVCRSHGHRLSSREFDFVANLAMSSRPPSEKQLAWLRDIYNRLTVPA